MTPEVVADIIGIIGDHSRAGYELGARYYDANLGRFTQMDPSCPEPNACFYAKSNPINAIDPTGLI